MQKYQSHKVVEAGKIHSVGSTNPQTKMTTLHLEGGENELVSYDWIVKHSDNIPKNLIGGYLVRYEDGYTSWSPAEAFEGGYSLIKE